MLFDGQGLGVDHRDVAVDGELCAVEPTLVWTRFRHSSPCRPAGFGGINELGDLVVELELP